MLRAALAIIAAVVAAEFLVTGCHPAESHFDPRQLPACATEDSPGPCFWDALNRGNGQGQSFWIDANGVVHYI